MSVHDLSRAQLRQLKEDYYTEKHANVSYGELFAIDSLVSDEEIFKAYESTVFVEDDFWK